MTWVRVNKCKKGLFFGLLDVASIIVIIVAIVWKCFDISWTVICVVNLKWYLQLFSHILAVCPAIADGRASQHRYTHQSLGKELKQSLIIPYLLKSVSTLASRGTAAMGPSGAASYGSAVVHFVAWHSGTSQVDRISLRGDCESSLAQGC